MTRLQPLLPAAQFAVIIQFCEGPAPRSTGRYGTAKLNTNEQAQAVGA